MKVNGKQVSYDSERDSVDGEDLFADDITSARNIPKRDFIESSTKQKRDPMKVVGKQVPHDSAVGHVTGEALFVDDLPFTKKRIDRRFYRKSCCARKNCEFKFR